MGYHAEFAAIMPGAPRQLQAVNSKALLRRIQAAIALAQMQGRAVDSQLLAHCASLEAECAER